MKGAKLTAALLERRCIVCDAKFTPKRKDALMCSSSCRQLKFREGVPIAGPRIRKPRFRLFEPFTFCG